MKTKTSLRSLYSFPGFQARSRFKSGVKGDPKARVIELVRRQKKAFAPAVAGRSPFSTTAGPTASVIWTAGTCESSWTSSIGAYPAQIAE